MDAAVSLFSENTKQMVTLLDIKPKLNTEKEKRLRLDFSMPMTAKAMEGANESIKEAFYAVCKESVGLESGRIAKEYQDVKVKFFATPLTKTPAMELTGCTLRQLEVSRPTNKLELGDGDVHLGFHINTPADQELWNWLFRQMGADLWLEFEEMQPMLPNLKAADPGGDGQGILNMDKSDASPTVVPPAKAQDTEVGKLATAWKTGDRARKAAAGPPAKGKKKGKRQ